MFTGVKHIERGYDGHSIERLFVIVDEALCKKSDESDICVLSDEAA